MPDSLRVLAKEIREEILIEVIKTERIRCAYAMLADGKDDEEVMKYTRVPEEEIVKIKKSIHSKDFDLQYILEMGMDLSKTHHG